MYSFSRESSIRKIGNNYLLIVYRDEGSAPLGLRVNESLALLIEYAREVELFSKEDLAGVLIREYSLSENQALKDAEATIEIWKKLGLI